MCEDDDPFIVLTETKFSIRCIPVWARYSPLRTRVEAHAIISHQDPTGALVIHLLLGRTRWSIRTPTVNPSQCTFVQMTDTDVAFLLYYRSCPYDRHDLYLPSLPASLQTLGRFECAVASAPAPHGLRINSPLTLTLVSSKPSGRLQKIGPEFFLPSVCLSSATLRAKIDLRVKRP